MNIQAPGPDQPAVLTDNLTTEPDQVAAPLASASDIVGSPTKPTITDWARISLAGGLILILGVLTLGTAWFVAVYPSKETAIESFLKLVYTPIVGLVGSVIGFYFGAHAAGGSSPSPGRGK